MVIKFLSWNIWCGKNLAEITSFLENNEFNIIALQEVLDAEGVNTADHLASILGMQYTYATGNTKKENGKTLNVGNAVLSKFPIITKSAHILSTQGRVATQADIKVGHQIIHVFSTHLVHTHQQASPLQEVQAENLVKILPKEKTILAGDFNALPNSNAIHKVNAVLKNTDIKNQPTWCLYPEGCETCKLGQVEHKLDYIFTTPDFHLKYTKVEESKASDHLAISATLAI